MVICCGCALEVTVFLPKYLTKFGNRLRASPIKARRRTAARNPCATNGVARVREDRGIGGKASERWSSTIRGGCTARSFPGRPALGLKIPATCAARQRFSLRGRPSFDTALTRHAPPRYGASRSVRPVAPKAICGLQSRASAVCRPLLSRGAGKERAARTAADLGHSLPCTSSVAAAVTPTAICDAAPTICSQTRTHTCLLRPIFCAFAPFSNDARLPPVPPRVQERAARTRAGFGHETPCVAQARLSRARSFKPRAIINSYAPIIMRSPLPLFGS